MATPRDRNIGLLLCRNEADVLPQFLPRHLEFFDAVVALDESTDGSREILLSCPAVKHLIRGEELPYERPLRDGMRQAALEEIRRRWGTGGWITLIHPDEWWVDDPNEAVAAAEAEGAECVLWHCLQYYLHPSQRTDFETPGFLERPVRKRLGLFQPGHYEYRQFRNAPGVDFEVSQHARVIPMGTDPERHLSAYSPVFAHYSLRSPAQAADRARDRLARDWHPAYASLLESVWVDRAYPDRPLLPREAEGDPWLRTFPYLGRGQVSQL